MGFYRPFHLRRFPANPPVYGFRFVHAVLLALAAGITFVTLAIISYIVWSVIGPTLLGFSFGPIG